MKTIFAPGMIAGLVLVCTLSAVGQTQGAPLSRPSTLPTSVHNALENTNNRYDYDFIAKGFVWSNQPLTSTAGKICQTMKDHAFAETPYGINNDQDWNDCLRTQIRSIGYLRWLRNGGFKPNPKNRTKLRRSEAELRHGSLGKLLLYPAERRGKSHNRQDDSQHALNCSSMAGPTYVASATWALRTTSKFCRRPMREWPPCLGIR